jgi:hypothetical protein
VKTHVEENVRRYGEIAPEHLARHETFRTKAGGEEIYIEAGVITPDDGRIVSGPQPVHPIMIKTPEGLFTDGGSYLYKTLTFHHFYSEPRLITENGEEHTTHIEHSETEA